MTIERFPLPISEVQQRQLLSAVVLGAIEIAEIELAPVIVGLGLLQVMHEVVADPPNEVINHMVQRHFQSAAECSANYVNTIFGRVIHGDNLFANLIEESGSLGRTALRSFRLVFNKSEPK